MMKSCRPVLKQIMTAGAMITCLLAQAKALASENFNVFSEVYGVVMVDGNPVAGATVERYYRWKQEKVFDKTTTDEQGRYHFPEIVRHSLIWSILPHEARISQSINIYHEGSVYSGWYHVKGNYDRNGELKGRPLKLKCDLRSPEGPHAETQHYGVCSVEKRVVASPKAA